MPPPSDANPTRHDAGEASEASLRVLVGVTGGIAAFKTASLVSTLVKSGAEVRVAMTEAAQRFVGKTTFQSLSGRPVIDSIWGHDDRPDSQHVGLARWCSVMAIAPCTAHTLAKLAAGFADDPVCLAASALPASTPLLIAPAMNADMWAHPVVQRNLTTLRDLLPNLVVVDPEDGWQACRTEGAGRMAEPETIAARIDSVLA